MFRRMSVVLLCAVFAELSPRFALGQTGTGDPCTPPGEVVVTDLAGDADASDPQLDIRSIAMADVFGGTYAGKFMVTLQVGQLDTPSPRSSSLWEVQWNGPASGASTTLVMSTCAAGPPVFSYSYSDGSGGGQSGAPDGGSFSAHGQIQFVLSRDKFGSPQPGDSLVGIGAITFHFSDTLCVPLPPFQTDQAGTGRYVINSCVLSVPPAATSGQIEIGPPIPNPARSGVHFNLDVPRDASGHLWEAAVYDVAGRRVRGLADGVAVAGLQRLTWDLRSDSGVRAEPGSYWVTVRVGSERQSRRIEVLR